MVHALGDIRRVLVPDGILIDLRPVLDRWPVEVVSAREARETGRLQDFSTGIADDEAANGAVARASENAWFSRDQEEFFPFYYSWDTPSEMEEWIADEWNDFLGLEETTKQATRSAWALGDADTRVRVRAKMLITKWRVRGASQS